MWTRKQNHMMYGSWHTEWGGIFCHFGPFFALFIPLTTQKMKILKKWKKPGDILILQKCTIDGNHMMYNSWDMERDGHNFFVILEQFLPFYFPNNLKNQNFEKIKKNAWRYHHLLKQRYYIGFSSVPKIWS